MDLPVRSEITIKGIRIEQIHFPEIDSTQVFSTKEAIVSSTENVWKLVTATMQTAGIGTHNRKWRSDIPGNVYASLSLPWKLESEGSVASSPENKKVLPFPQLSAIAVFSTLKSFFDAVGVKPSVKFKWPNDVIVDNKKISGSMVNMFKISDDWYQSTIGVGVNVNLSQEILNTIDQPATSMAVIAKKGFDEKEVLSVYLNNFIELLNNYQTKKEGFFDAFYGNMAFLGEKVIVHDDVSGKDLVGNMVGVDNHGFLVFKEDGEAESTTIMSGTLRKYE
jgi:BirA family biotin operon repressor/biotin-[acetyl-CoA-carboxylase] ligase